MDTLSWLWLARWDSNDMCRVQNVVESLEPYSKLLLFCEKGLFRTVSAVVALVTALETCSKSWMPFKIGIWKLCYQASAELLSYVQMGDLDASPGLWWLEGWMIQSPAVVLPLPTHQRQVFFKRSTGRSWFLAMDKAWFTAKADPDSLGTLTDNIHVFPLLQ